MKRDRLPYSELRFLWEIRIRCWLGLCSPRGLQVKYKCLPQYYNLWLVFIYFQHGEKRFCVSLPYDQDDPFDYKLFTNAFFKAYKRLYYKLERGKSEKQTTKTNSFKTNVTKENPEET